MATLSMATTPVGLLHDIYSSDGSTSPRNNSNSSSPTKASKPILDKKNAESAEESRCKAAALAADPAKLAVFMGYTPQSPSLVVKAPAPVPPALLKVQQQERNTVSPTKRRPPPPPLTPPPPPAKALVKTSFDDETVIRLASQGVQQQRQEPKIWKTLRSRGAKLYAWACAARLSAEALEAATRMLDYMEWDNRRPIGSRLSMDALREIGAEDDEDDDGYVQSRRNRRKAHVKNGPRASEDEDAGRAIAAHLATFRFQSALDLAVSAEYSDEEAADEGTHESGSTTLFDLPSTQMSSVLSASSAKAAAAYGLAGVLSASSAKAAAAYGLADDEPAGSSSSEEEGGTLSTAGGSPPIHATKTPIVGGGNKAKHRVNQPPIELYPKTKAVGALHDALSRGDALGVINAAVSGAGSSGRTEIGAFATMARALHVAAARDGAFGAPRTGMIELLVSLGADPCAPDAFGYTPLHVAAACGNVGAAVALLAATRAQLGESGAARAAALRCQAGLTALEVALARRRDARELYASMLCRGRAFDVDFGDGPMGISIALVRTNNLSSPPPSLSSPPSPQLQTAAAATVKRQAAAPSAQQPTPPCDEAQQQQARRRRTQQQQQQQQQLQQIRRRRPPPPPPSMSTKHRRQITHRRNLSDGSPAVASRPSPPKAHRRQRSTDDSAHRRPRDEVGEEDDGIASRTLSVNKVTDMCVARGQLDIGDQLLAINGSVVACPDEDGFADFMSAVKNLPRPIRATFVAGSFPFLSVEDDPVIHLLKRVSPVPEPAHQDQPLSAKQHRRGDDEDDDSIRRGDEY